MFIIMFMTFVYGLVGMQLFGYTFINPDGSYPRLNFNSFRSSVVTLFQVITLDNWVSIVCDGLQSSALTSRILIIPYVFTLFSLPPSKPHVFNARTRSYLVSFVIIECYVLLNLFVAVVVEKFELTNDVKEAEQRSRNKKNKTESPQEIMQRRAETVNRLARKAREIVRRLMRRKVAPEEMEREVAAGRAAAAHRSKDPEFGPRQSLQVHLSPPPPPPL